MAKSVSVLFLFLAVLTITVMGFAAGVVSPEFAESFPKWVKTAKEVKEKLNHLNDSGQKVIDALPKREKAPSSAHWAVTDIKVDGKTILNGQDGGSVVLITSFPSPFLSKGAYNLVAKEFSDYVKPAGSFGLMCIADQQLSPVTLVLDVNGAAQTLECPWVEQSDGQKCLGILRAIWA